ncbi:hypothetical protein [Antrihabitans sp. YC2-6]|uniref:hypothetical protein n=1 Tax=Antrihabitans sp. YC2-6 TaxID=2799498 RepID=UPI0018F76B4B|nr:hypothetical protein [Antrihabitans sp. YC2-6]MBJ8343944.1 hypothetical protein [Antrihabitans sp. YC2-6]
MKEEASTVDSIETSVGAQEGATDRKTYVVTSESGLFKRGEQFDKGSTIELDDQTAANFIEAGDVAEVRDEN